MHKLYCCGITSTETDKIKEIIERTKNYVDGFCWCVDSNTNSDKTFKLLEENKKDGKIVRHLWQNAHDWQANEWLHCGLFKDGDWILMLDSVELPSELFISNIQFYINQLKNQNSQALYASGRPYLFKFNEYLYFQFSPHWMLAGGNGKIVMITDKEKDKLIINKRHSNPDKHFQEHDTKYYLYGRSNQIEMFYGKYGQEIVNYHENIRRKFRQELKNLGYECNLIGLEKYFKEGKFSAFALETIELEFCLSEFFQRKILNHDFMSFIVPRRKQFSFIHWLNGGDGFPENYESTTMKYNKQFNIKEG